MADLPKPAGASADRELEYILSRLEHELFPDRTFPAPESGLDWERMHILLVRHRLAGLFYGFRKIYPDVWPDSFLGELRREHYRLLLYGDHCTVQVRMVLEAMRAAGIDVIVLKGWAFIQTLYGGDPSQRLCEDIDILVRPEEVDAAEAAMQKTGFRGDEESWPGYNRRYTHGRRYFFSTPQGMPGWKFSIGFHWSLLYIPSYPPGGIDLGALFKRAHPLQVAGVEVLGLANEDQIVHACAHQWLHHRNEDLLLRYYETAALIRSAGQDLDWDEVLERAVTWRVVPPLQNVLAQMDILWPGVVPPGVKNRLVNLKPTAGERLVDRWAPITKDRPTYAHLITWLTFRDWKQRPLIMLQDIFPCRAYMQKRYGKAVGGLWPLLYFKRFAGAFQYLSSQTVIK